MLFKYVFSKCANLPKDEHHTEPNLRPVFPNLNGKIRGYQTAKHSVVMEG